MRFIVLLLLGAFLWLVASVMVVRLLPKLDKKPIYAVTLVGTVLISHGGGYGIYKLGEYWDMMLSTKIILGLCAMGVLVASMVNDRKQK